VAGYPTNLVAGCLGDSGGMVSTETLVAWSQ
jgi:hypothetical protein